MSKLVWDKTGERLFEAGVKNVALYPQENGLYPKGVAWNGVTNVTESPSGAEASPFYANDSKYLNLMSNEEFGGSIEAYTYPDEFAACDGSAELVEGVTIGQQPRKEFGYAYKTTLGNDTEKENYGYILHLVYGALASPTEKAYGSINENIEPIAFSWDITTTPVAVKGHKPTSILKINSTKVDAEKLAALEAILYGSEDQEPRLPLPDEIATLMAA